MGALHIAWLDLSPAQMATARAHLRDAKDEGVVDELGFGVLQGAIADVLYPGVNTIMTRARYFYFLPALLEHLEREGTRAGDFARKARERQVTLSQVLKVTEPQLGSGVIGRDAGMALQRMPSNIYWNGLRKLGLFLQPLSESGYHQQVDGGRAARKAVKDDDATRHPGGDVEPFWDSKRPPPAFLDAKGEVLSTTTFRLTRREAADLAQRFAKQREDSLGHGALLPVLVDEPSGADFAWPWDVPGAEPGLSRLLEEAQRLSALARGMGLVYMALVLQLRQRHGLALPELDVREACDNWLAAVRPLFAEWDIGATLAHPVVSRGLRPGDVRELGEFLTRCRASADGAGLLRDRDAQDVVSRRERRLKRYKTRLRAGRYLQEWSPPSSAALAAPYELGYRHRTGVRMARDIRAGLGRP
ncbi:DUF6361 family protein [Corallococcus macrosporus]|uniref:Uncharacterized protein n=1 Tax=Myxococcus fulvus (strain ATCC BAA-855 / HW-1) TaxID=483219 RepID=F8C6L8_MYXFH|nr:DUF6361 family protein [Corallococcus macrosporus]AEI65607.1 hypothetical protein LILAB_18525 [Corallococcus macrosporus]